MLEKNKFTFYITPQCAESAHQEITYKYEYAWNIFWYYIAQSDVSVYTKDLRGAGRHKLQRQSELNQMFNIFIVFDSIMI